VEFVMKKTSLFFFLIVVFTFTACDLTVSDDGSGGSDVPLTAEAAAEGLRDGLIDCASRTITQVGAENGYFSDELIKILLPEEAQTVVNEVKNTQSFNIPFVGTYSIANYVNIQETETNMIKAMNRAAEKAAASITTRNRAGTLDIFKDAITNLTIEDAFDLLRGNVPASRADEEAVEDTPYAATIYLKRETFPSLKTTYTPIVNEVLNDKTIIGIGFSVNEIWSGFVLGVGTWNSIPGIPSNYKVSSPPSDLSDYIITKALNGLFYYIGVFEKELRETFSILFDAADAIYEAFQWAEEQVGNLEEATGLDILGELPEFTL
jgi:hypothetical protein